MKKTAATRGLVVIDLASEGSEIMRTAAADTQLSESQREIMERAKSAPAATEVKLMVGPHPAVLEYALIGDANCPTEPVKIAVPLGDGTSKAITRCQHRDQGRQGDLARSSG